MIFLNESHISTVGDGMPSALASLNKELGLNEAELSKFDHFANPNCAYEIMYESEVAQNKIRDFFLNEEVSMLLEAEEGETEKPSFLKRVAEKIKQWWEAFKKFLGNVWNAIKKFFRSVYEFIFKHKLWKARRERIKKAAERGEVTRLAKLNMAVAKKIESIQAQADSKIAAAKTAEEVETAAKEAAKAIDEATKDNALKQTVETKDPKEVDKSQAELKAAIAEQEKEADAALKKSTEAGKQIEKLSKDIEEYDSDIHAEQIEKAQKAIKAAQKKVTAYKAQADKALKLANAMRTAVVG